ncbi:ovarian cancer G-protein coupled receptor 1 isoform X2 [Numida meleagris]|uniref:ovarian cancer G-protein coupled receptor 1 isoform X2 n=1 Tax=Numida meleagris TaxID=8996 RepID=UPI000B3DFB0A|nr:ovarian cancer G-protein coupled receptor 1 isoform X2 [Numida meleagris]
MVTSASADETSCVLIFWKCVQRSPLVAGYGNLLEQTPSQDNLGPISAAVPDRAAVTVVPSVEERVINVLRQDISSA